MKNKFTKLLLAFILLIMVVLGYSYIQNQKTIKGEKKITITAIDYRTEPPLYLINEETYNTDALYLGELLDEINKKDLIFVLQGNKSDMYGRMLVSIKDVNQDPNANQYWLYESSNNESCKSAGFCNGVDQLPIADQDIFIFILK